MRQQVPDHDNDPTIIIYYLFKNDVFPPRWLEEMW